MLASNSDFESLKFKKAKRFKKLEWYFESKNVNDLAEKLNWAFQNPKAMDDLAKETKQTVEREYLVSKVVKQYIDLYDQTLFPTKMISSPDRI